jgi:hypothetical protein
VTRPDRLRSIAAAQWAEDVPELAAVEQRDGFKILRWFHATENVQLLSDDDPTMPGDFSHLAGWGANMLYVRFLVEGKAIVPKVPLTVAVMHFPLARRPQGRQLRRVRRL